MAHNELVDKWLRYVYRSDRDAVARLVGEFPNRRHLEVDYGLFGMDYEFTNPLLSDPDRTFRAGKEALKRFVSEEGLEHSGPERLDNVYIRIANFPETRNASVGDLRAAHLGELVSVEGTIASQGPVRPKLVTAAFRCERCDAVTRRVPQPGYEFRSVPDCTECGSVGFLNFVPERSSFVDSQEVRLSGRSNPRDSVPVVLEHELVDAVGERDDVTVVGIPRARRSGESTVFDMHVETVNAAAAPTQTTERSAVSES